MACTVKLVKLQRLRRTGKDEETMKRRKQKSHWSQNICIRIDWVEIMQKTAVCLQFCLIECFRSICHHRTIQQHLFKRCLVSGANMLVQSSRINVRNSLRKTIIVRMEYKTAVEAKKKRKKKQRLSLCFVDVCQWNVICGCQFKCGWNSLRFPIFPNEKCWFESFMGAHETLSNPYQ